MPLAVSQYTKIKRVMNQEDLGALEGFRGLKD
jgi:hypothetical protein